tara:strand:- start:13563 stop:16133 length:2571 start_codon:yes stop_codon:yes gene_type:complete
MKKLLFILLLTIVSCAAPKNCCAYDSWVRFQVQFDYYAPTESNFFMVSDSTGDTSIFYQPTTQYEYLDTIIDVWSGNYTVTLNDSFGDGWVSQQPASFRVGNICQGPILSWDPVVGSFFQRDSTITILPCPPPGPPPPCVPTLIIVNLDQYPEETSWEIEDSLGNILLTGGPYTNVPDYQPQYIVNCLPQGNLTFTINDTYGDGLAGTLWGGQDGSYYVVQCGDTLVFGDVPNFGNDSSHTFLSDTCIPPPPVPGCMDDDYVEYNPLATVDDSSCTVLKIYGCIDSTMYNYDPIANTMEDIDSCGYTLILHDLIGNGWVGTRLEIWQDADTSIFIMTSQSFNQTFDLGLYAPAEVNAKLFVSQQAQHTAVECGFTLINPLGDTTISIQPPFIIPFNTYTTTTYCGNICEEKVYGCLDSLAFNYIDSANTALPCYYYPGCISPAYLEYHVDTANGYYTDINVQDSCITSAVFGCTDPLAFNYNNLANVDNGGCLPVITGCMQPLAFNYNPNANTPDTCIQVIFGCTSPIAFNYNPLANTDDGTCEGVVYGCTDTSMWNYAPLANVDDSSCVPYIYGCMDATMFNYNSLANTDNGSCIPFIYGCMDTSAFNYDPLANTDNGTCIPIILGCTNPIALNYCDTCNTDDFSCILPIYGCTDSTMFNFNPLANVDNNTCIPFVYGCTDPAALNYNPNANTEDFSCIAYIYGCTDSTAINYDSLANTDNGSCIEAIVGCMDPNAWNYNPLANVILGHDSLGCLYAADCSATEPGEPFFLNDGCYAWVIEVDEYCCENEWDSICQLTYEYCYGTYAGPLMSRVVEAKELILVTDLLGRPSKEIRNKLLLYIYSDGSVERKITIK